MNNLVRSFRYDSFSAILIMLLSLAGFQPTTPVAAQQPGDLFLAADTIDFGDGVTMPAEFGYFFVPENRDKSDSRTIAIAVLRFKSTAAEPKEPIFLLAGGPGSSYIAPLKRNDKGYFTPSVVRMLIEDLRSVGDVVIPDQRGSGLSIPFLSGSPRKPFGRADQRTTPQERTEYLQQHARESRQKWIDSGHDLEGYHPIQLADDVEQLRAKLGYGKICLCGGSFGSQSSFTILRRHPEIVSRVALWGIEDIDHTCDMPSGILESLTQIIADAENDPDVAPHVPDGGILEAVKRTIRDLESTPIVVSVDHPQTGEATNVAIGADAFRSAWHSGARRNGPQAWPGNLLPVFKGDFTGIAKQILAFKTMAGGSQLSPGALLYSMDCGLLPSEDRAEQLKNDPAISILGDINASYYARCEVWGSPDVSEAFKDSLKTDIPALFLQGTCDTSTPLMNAISASAGYSNGHLLVVERATHGIPDELYRERPDFIRPLLKKFFRGESIEGTPERITLPPADFLGPDH